MMWTFFVSLTYPTLLTQGLVAERGGDQTATCISSRISFLNSNPTLLFNQAEIEKSNNCQHAFRVLEDLCDMFSSLMFASIVTSLEV